MIMSNHTENLVKSEPRRDMYGVKLWQPRPWAITVRLHVDGALILPVGRDTGEWYLNLDVNRHYSSL